MRKKVFFSFWLLLTMGMATVVFNSCGNDEEEGKGKDSIAVAAISLDKTSLTLSIGEDDMLTATVMPDNASDKTVTWTSSDNTKVTVSGGKVTAVSEGAATITAQAGNQTATCTVTVKKVTDPSTVDAGVFINGVKWATRNVDAPGKFAVTPESSGMFYQWNRKQAWSATDPGEGIAIGLGGGWDNTVPAGTEWEKANDPSPSGWRVSTREEIASLFDASKVKNEWVTQNGVTGRKFTDLSNENNFIFLPAVGYRIDGDGTLYDADLIGYYWSSTALEVSETIAYYLLFVDGAAGWDYYLTRSWGFSVRAVAEN